MVLSYGGKLGGAIFDYEQQWGATVAGTPDCA